MRYGTKKGWLCLAVFWLTLLLGTVVSGVLSLYTVPDTPESLLASTLHWWEPLKVIGGFNAGAVYGKDPLREISNGTRVSNCLLPTASPAAAEQGRQRPPTGA